MVCFFNYATAFDVFSADIQQADTRLAVTRIHGAEQLSTHYGKLQQLGGGAIHVGAQIQHQGETAAFGGHEFGNRRPVDTGQGFEHETGGGH